jgi:hypothetical protein
MKKLGKLFILVLLGLIAAGVTGCQKDEKTSADAMMKNAAEATPPAAQVPKDHPAH